jgi:hypothetical protein
MRKIIHNPVYEIAKMLSVVRHLALVFAFDCE